MRVAGISLHSSSIGIRKPSREPVVKARPAMAALVGAWRARRALVARQRRFRLRGANIIKEMAAKLALLCISLSKYGLWPPSSPV